jgi:hypothetical protein
MEIYNFIPVSGCVGMGPSALLCPGAYNAVKTTPIDFIYQTRWQYMYIDLIDLLDQKAKFSEMIYQPNWFCPRIWFKHPTEIFPDMI